MEQIQKLTVDLATTRSLLDVQDKDRQAANAGASTSAPTTMKPRIPAHVKGKKTPSRTNTSMESAGSKRIVPSKASNSVKLRLNGGDSDGEASSIDSDGSRWVPLWQTIQKKKTS